MRSSVIRESADTPDIDFDAPLSLRSTLVMVLLYVIHLASSVQCQGIWSGLDPSMHVRWLSISGSNAKFIGGS